MSMNNNKKVGIITFHRSYNYGAALQAYATVQFFASNGYNPVVIDYCPSNLNKYGSFKALFNDVSNSGSPLPIRAAKALIKSFGNEKRLQAFNRFIDGEMPLTRKYYSCQELKNDLPPVDIFCTGSDQVWNNYYTKEFDPSFFLAFAPEGSTCISIAASFGKETFDQEDMDFIKRELRKYDYLSVRENTGLELLHKLGYDDADLMLDPTLLLQRNIWSSFASLPTKGDYVLVYQLHGESETTSMAREYAKREGLPVRAIVTMPYQCKPGCKHVIAPDVHEWVGLFKEARCVFTDSFHGTVFSLLFDKQLAVTLPPRFGSRITSLLNAIGGESLICSNLDEWSSRQASIDKQGIQKALDQLCEQKQTLLGYRLKSLN